MKKYISAVAALALVSTLMTGCSDSSSDDNEVADVAQFKAVFVDSFVGGVSWNCGNNSGITAADGVFGACDVGTEVTFSIGTVSLGSLSAEETQTYSGATGPVVTPTVLAGGEGDEATKIAMLLQSADSDGNPANGITIDEATTTAISTQFAGQDITSETFTTDDMKSNTDAVVETIKTTNPESSMSSVSADDALTHLGNTQSDIENGNITGPENPTTPTETGAES